MELSRNDKRKFGNLRHKLFIFWLRLEKGSRVAGEVMPEDEVKEIEEEVDRATKEIWPEYSSRLDAPLWLDRLMREAGAWRAPAIGEEWQEPKLFHYFNG